MTLITLRIRCRELSQRSRDSPYSSTTSSEIVATLNRRMESIERAGKLNRDELKLLFAPTGALQETAIDNGWADEYLLLSEQFDRLIE